MSGRRQLCKCKKKFFEGCHVVPGYSVDGHKYAHSFDLLQLHKSSFLLQAFGFQQQIEHKMVGLSSL